MKKFLSILVVLFVYQFSHAQDKIFTKDKQELNVKIIEQNEKSIRYTMGDFDENTIFTIKLNRVEKIEYRNERVDLMGYQNPRKSRPFSMSFGGLAFRSKEGGAISASLGYFLIPQICFEVNTGTQLEDNIFFSAGSKFHLNSTYSTNRITPFTGIFVGSEENFGFIQVPVGVNYISRKGFNASVSVNQQFYYDNYQDTFFEIKLGWNIKI